MKNYKNLLNSIIEIDEVEFLITTGTVDLIQSGKKMIPLIRLVDGEEKLMSIKKIQESLKKRGVIDHLK